MKFLVHIPFVELLGFELLRFEHGEAEIAMQLREQLTNSWGVAHGGVSMTMLDVVMAHAARSPGEDGVAESSGVVTVEMKTSFLRPGLGRLVGTGKRLHRTASLAFCEALARRRRRPARRPRHRHIQVPERPARRRQAHPASQRVRLRKPHGHANRQIHLVSRPTGEASVDNFRLRRGAARRAGRRAGAGAPPLS